MEHILQFAVGIDDNAIAERVIAAATRELVKDVKKDIYQDTYYNSGFADMSRQIITEAIDSYKDEIINKAAEKLYESIKRSKKFKEIVGDALSEAE